MTSNELKKLSVFQWEHVYFSKLGYLVMKRGQTPITNFAWVWKLSFGCLQFLAKRSRCVKAIDEQWNLIFHIFFSISLW